LAQELILNKNRTDSEKRLEYRNDKLRKFWKGEVNNKEMIFRYGKIDAKGQISV
jgi:predicted DNA-binding WGR domain protein